MYSRPVRISLPLIISFVLLALGTFLLPRPLTHAEPNYNCATATGLPQTECEALVALYNATGGSDWTNNTDWLVTTTPCNWYGVTCDAGSVTSLFIHFNNLSGYLPPEIGNFSRLTTLYLYGNQLTSLPPEIGNLSSLTTLDLGDNQLTSLPPEIGNLSSLTHLYLSDNQLTSLPPEIGDLSSLAALYLYDNQLANLPPEIGDLSSLATLYLYGNPLTSLPPEIGNLSSLITLYLGDNQLTSLPSEIGNLSNLITLHLYDNHLTSLPPEIGNLSSLTYLYLYDNQLTNLPPEIGNLSSLITLHLGDNQLTNLPIEIGNLSNLTHLDLQSNQLTSLPVEIGNISSLYNLVLSENQLISLPVEIGNISSLDILNLSKNQLTSLPIEIDNLTSLYTLDLSENQLISLPVEINNIFTLHELSLSENPLSGAMPVELTNLIDLTSFDYIGTSWCNPDTVIFNIWLDSISTIYGTGLVCGQNPGAISGIISNADSIPLTTTQVTLYRDFYWQWILVDTIATDNAGQYIFNNLGQGIDYRVHFEEENSNYIPEYYDNVSTIDTATPITVTLGITRTDINAILEVPQPPIVDVDADSGSINVNPDGMVMINMTQSNRSDITMTHTITCTGGATPSLVKLQLEMATGTITYTMSSVGNDQYRTTIPTADLTADATLNIKITCNGIDDTTTVGTVNLYDPSGNITNLFTHQPIVGATVTLYQVPNWRPRTSPSDTAVDTCESNDSKTAGVPWSQPAPIGESIIVNTDLTTVAPLLNHQQTDIDGHYGWDVPEGCWYVVVRADGYETLTSPVVGIPPEVTDLHLTLTPTGSHKVYLPMITR